MTEAHQLTTALIVDDHPLFCDALAMTLKAVAGLSRVETADCLEAAIDRLDAGEAHGTAGPDVVVLDLNLPDVNGLEGLIRLRQLLRATPILVVSSMADNRMISACLQAGAAGFVPKHAGREVFRTAFEALRAGRVFTPEGYVALGSVSLQEAAISRLALLTRQQTRILQLICEGKLNKQIAYELTIAETTVKAHVTAIMRKLGVQSRTQAVLLAGEANFSSLLPEG